MTSNPALQVLLAFACAQPLACAAMPSIEGMDLVSSTRVDRTKFDYRYSIRLRVDESSYSGASIGVSSSSAGVVVLKTTVALGDLDAGTSLRSSDTFVVRTDRSVAFDRSSLKFTFSGEKRNGSAGSARFGPVVFVEPGGRPGHEGSFPTQQFDPVAGASTTLRVSISGDVVTSAKYYFIAPDGATLYTGPLVKTSDLRSVFIANTTAPSTPFKIRLEASTGLNEVSTWTSAAVYSPRGFRTIVTPQVGNLKKGQTTQASIAIASTTASGWHDVRLSLPDGFVGSGGPWRVLLTPGATTTIATSFTAPVLGLSYEIRSIDAFVSAVGTDATAGSVSRATIVLE